mgnify:FL=1
MRWLAIALLFVACDGSPAPGEGGVSPGRDAGPPGVPVPRSGLPVGADDALRLGPGADLDVASALTQDATGRVTLIFESFDEALTRGELWSTDSADGSAFRVARPIGFTEHPFEASPSFVGGSLYFAGADDLSSPPTLYRGQVGAPSALPSVEGLESLLSWPKLYEAGERVALAFRDGASLPRVALGADPASLGPPRAIGEQPAAMVTLGVFGSGALAATYQHPVGGEPMVSFVVRSEDGESWSAPARVTEASPNVHDTTLVGREDGALDLYYAYPASASGFALFRRRLAEDGALGAEERVTADALGETTKPEGLRLASGDVLIATAVITARGSGGEPTRQEMTLIRLSSEAPE